VLPVPAVSSLTTRKNAQIKENTMSEIISFPVPTQPAECSHSASTDATFDLSNYEREEHHPQPNEEEIWKAFQTLLKAW
jgi:hypothetical protein